MTPLHADAATMKFRAYAKINLGLRILRKRPDGYHDIETIFHRVNLFDEIELQPSADLSLTLSGAPVPTDGSNLCLRAAHVLRDQMGIRDGAVIHLLKRIPLGAGLGGGSSDAAAVLIGLCRLWNIPVSYEHLHQMASQLGSDVPYFLTPGTAHATGRGEVLEYLTLSLPYWIVLVYPNIPVSTAWAYQHCTPSNERSATSLRQAIITSIQKFERWPELVVNDFEELVLASYPEIETIRRALLHQGAHFAQLSGSGSSIYGLFQQEQDAANTAADLGSRYQVFLTPPDFEADEVIATPDITPG